MTILVPRAAFLLAVALAKRNAALGTRMDNDDKQSTWRTVWVSRKHRPQTSDLENSDLENADLENSDPSKIEIYYGHDPKLPLPVSHTGKFVSHTPKFYAMILAENSLRQPRKYLSMRHADRQTNS